MAASKEKQTTAKATDATDTKARRQLLARATPLWQAAKKYKRPLIPLACVVLVLLLMWGGWAFYTASRSCENYIPKGQGSLAPSQNAQVKIAVDKMMATKNYNRNPNCLNVITTYYINNSDYDKARSSLDQLEKVYNPQIGYSQRLRQTNPKSLDVLKSDVTFLEQLSNQTLKNGRRLLSP